VHCQGGHSDGSWLITLPETTVLLVCWVMVPRERALPGGSRHAAGLRAARLSSAGHECTGVLAELRNGSSELPPGLGYFRVHDRSGDRLTLEEIERVQIGKKHEI
jgi:hypothetical protein